MEEKDSCYHVPVMLRESLEGLDIRPDGIYVDVTFGGWRTFPRDLETVG